MRVDFPQCSCDYPNAHSSWSRAAIWVGGIVSSGLEVPLAAYDFRSPFQSHRDHRGSSPHSPGATRTQGTGEVPASSSLAHQPEAMGSLVILQTLLLSVEVSYL